MGEMVTIGSGSERKDFWSSRYTVFTEHLPPASYDSLTQLGRGDYRVHQAVAIINHTSLLRMRFEPRSYGVFISQPGIFYLAVPLNCGGDRRMNGQPARPSSILFPYNKVEFHSHGTARDFIGLGVPREALVRTLAALNHQDPDKVVLPSEYTVLPTNVFADLSRQFSTIVEQANQSTFPRCDLQDPETVENVLFSQVVDICQFAMSDHTSNETGFRCSPFKIVRDAEEWLMANLSEKVSLADLCRATGVSKGVLYKAFQYVSGETPLRYVKRRKLGIAREYLLQEPNTRGRITKVACALGLTEFGRFSQEYSLLFREQPSKTLAYEECRPNSLAGCRENAGWL
jgi:AraC-like DNA-binding protein